MKQVIVYMVDDDDDDQEILNDVIHEINAAIICVPFSNGKEALMLLSNEGVSLPDFIFLDLNMPVMNGFEFLKQIKEHKEFQEIPVIVYTTSSEPKHIEKANKLGAAYFLTKPSSLRLLKTELNSIFSRN